MAVGGGSAVGLGKAIALEHGLPVIAVPTTYAGSEMTPVWGVTENGEKRTGRDRRVLPVSVVYDPELTLTLPIGMTVTSGFNAIAHAVEGLYAPDATPVVSLMAGEGVRALASALPRIVAAPTDLEARGDAQYGAWLCGAVLGATTMSLHHKLCHALGGCTRPAPRGHPHRRPATRTGLQRPGGPVRRRRPHLGAGWSCRPSPRPVGPGRRAGRSTVSRRTGHDRADVDRIVDQVLAAPYANPREVTRNGLRGLLDRAREGAPPSSSGPSGA